MTTISIVMPTYQDSAAAVATAEILRGQLQHGDELLIVDNGSGADHQAVCEAFAGRHPGLGIRVLVCSTRGSYAARNLGAAHASGDILAFTDAGCLPCAGWLEAIRSQFTADAPSRIAGPIEMTYRYSPPSLVELVDARTHLNQSRYVAEGWAATANTAMRRQAFLALGGFHPSLQSGGDYEFGVRARAHGHGIAWCPGMLVQHEARHTVHELMKKRRRIRLGQAQIARLAEFPELRHRALLAGTGGLPVEGGRIYPPMSMARWLLARMACRLLHVYERHSKTVE